MLSRTAFALALQRRRTCLIRAYSDSVKPKDAPKEKADTESERRDKLFIDVPLSIGVEILSSCPENTVLAGLNYLKDQPPVVARADNEYPDWLWNLVKPKNIPDDGAGGRGERIAMRRANKQRIKEQNFLKTQ